MLTEHELLMERFAKEMTTYYPNWNAIINVNHITPDIFGKRLEAIRKERDLSQAEMGERLSYSKQAISKLEKGKNKKIPVDKLEFISNVFSVSVAYLLGLEKEAKTALDKRHYYFLEHPKNDFEYIKNDIFNDALIYPMETFGASTDKLLTLVIEGLKEDYALLSAIYRILRAQDSKKKNACEIIKSIEKIL